MQLFCFCVLKNPFENIGTRINASKPFLGELQQTVKRDTLGKGVEWHRNRIFKFYFSCLLIVWMFNMNVYHSYNLKNISNRKASLLCHQGWIRTLRLYLKLRVKQARGHPGVRGLETDMLEPGGHAHSQVPFMLSRDYGLSRTVSGCSEKAIYDGDPGLPVWRQPLGSPGLQTSLPSLELVNWERAEL